MLLEGANPPGYSPPENTKEAGSVFLFVKLPISVNNNSSLGIAAGDAKGLNLRPRPVRS
jgi:hypothetical protein